VEPLPDTEIGVERCLLDPSRRREVRALMSRHVGVLRDAGSLAAATGGLGSIARQLQGDVTPGRAAWEGTNLLTVASAVVLAASAREESRGCHRRTDFPDPREEWRYSQDVRLDAVGTLHVTG
jgi:L-aspartate oxidase